jgi:Ni/Co efflux regulator RcnB
MFKRTILAAVALSMFAVPMAQAQSRHNDGPRSGHHYSQPKKPAYQAPRQHRAQKPAPQRHHWAKGKRVPDWQRRTHVRDYGRYGLRKPANGQRWVKVDNDYLLISLATGVILGMAAAR